MSEERNLQAAYDFISRVNKSAYRDTFLLTNQVLSKNPFTNDFLIRFLNNEEPRPVSFGRVISKLLSYYLKSFKRYFLYLLEFMVFRLHRPASSLPVNREELVLLDTFFVFDKILAAGHYTDSYFTGVKGALDKKKKLYAYVPIFSGSRKFMNLGRVMDILNRQKIPIICEYQLLSVRDLLHALYFITVYPFHVIGFACRLPAKDDAFRLLKNELMLTLDWLTLDSFSRYLQGRRIAGLPYAKIKVLSWYENQVKDKNLYKGLKEPNAKVTIYGAQLFLYPQSIQNIIPDENEEPFGIVPDKILVNGPAFIPERSGLNYHVGPSLRYARLFSYSAQGNGKNGILVLLPYFKDEIDTILNMVSRLKGNDLPLRIKLHPSVALSEVKDALPPRAEIVKEDIYSLFKTTKIIVGSGTGTLVEAASLGIPVIVVKNNRKLDHNYLPDYGKGMIWDDASTPQELMQKMSDIVLAADRNPAEIASIADRYKEMFFCNPLEENIVKAFDI